MGGLYGEASWQGEGEAGEVGIAGLVVPEAGQSVDSFFLSSAVQVGFVLLATKRVPTLAWHAVLTAHLHLLTPFPERSPSLPVCR